MSNDYYTEQCLEKCRVFLYTNYTQLSTYNYLLNSVLKDHHPQKKLNIIQPLLNSMNISFSKLFALIIALFYYSKKLLLYM